MAKDGNLYVNDSLNRRISVFDSVGRFVRSFPVKGFPAEEIVVDSSGKVFVCNMPAMAQGQARGIVTMYDREGKRLRDLGEPLLLLEKGAYGRPYFAGSGLAMTRKEELIVWYTYPYLIRFYESGRLVKVIERADPAFQEPVVAETEFKALDGSVRRTRAVKIRCHLWKVLVLPQGHLAAFIQDYGPDYKNKPALSREFTTRIDLFDAEGRFLVSFDWDWQQRGLLKHVDREGYFYSNCGSSGIVPGVTKWKVWFD